MEGYEVRVVDEHGFSGAQCARLGRLLQAQWPNYSDTGVLGGQRPEFRGVVVFGRRIVATLSAIPLRSVHGQSGLDLMYGLGAMVVDPKHRGHDLCRRVNRAVIPECWRRGASALITATKVPLISGFLTEEFGFMPVPEGRITWHDNDGREHSKGHYFMAVRLRLPDGLF